MIQALMLKIAALSLLLLIGQNPNLPADFQAQAREVANQAMTAADAQLASASTDATSTPSLPTSPAPITASPIINNPPPMAETAPEAAVPASKARVEIVSPIPGKGIDNRDFTAAPQVVDEHNYVETGVIVYDDAGNPTSQATVVITATDETQGKTLKGTGVIFPHYVDGIKRVDPVYSFHYEFRTTGMHTITFTTDGHEVSVMIPVK